MGIVAHALDCLLTLGIGERFSGRFLGLWYHKRLAGLVGWFFFSVLSVFILLFIFEEEVVALGSAAIARKMSVGTGVKVKRMTLVARR